MVLHVMMDKAHLKPKQFSAYAVPLVAANQAVEKV